MIFSPLQKLVAEHYCDGDMAWMLETAAYNEASQLEHCGDGLFEFLINEAQDATDMVEFQGMLDRAIRQMQVLQQELPE